MNDFIDQTQYLIRMQQLDQRLKQLEERTPEVQAYRAHSAALDARRAERHRQHEVALGVADQGQEAMSIWEEYVNG